MIHEVLPGRLMMTIYISLKHTFT